MKRITAAYAWGDGDGLVMFNEDDHSEIQALLLGHTIETVFDDHMLLDDGTLIKIVANEGCGGCTSGGYELSVLNRVDNVITSVEFVDRVEEDSEYPDTIYEVFVVAADERINLYAVQGDDGDVNYGTRYRLLVRGVGP